MSALANAGPDCDPCGGPLKVIVQNKEGLKFWYINVSKIKNSNGLCLSFLYIFNKIVKRVIYLIFPMSAGPRNSGARLRQIGPVGQSPAL